jgi:hypothetical protein
VIGGDDEILGAFQEDAEILSIGELQAVVATDGKYA